MDALVIDHEALAPQHDREPAVTEPSALVGKRFEPLE
jgi:hypothetical protein